MATLFALIGYPWPKSPRKNRTGARCLRVSFTPRVDELRAKRNVKGFSRSLEYKKRCIYLLLLMFNTSTGQTFIFWWHELTSWYNSDALTIPYTIKHLIPSLPWLRSTWYSWKNSIMGWRIGHQLLVGLCPSEGIIANMLSLLCVRNGTCRC